MLCDTPFREVIRSLRSDISEDTDWSAAKDIWLSRLKHKMASFRPFIKFISSKKYKELIVRNIAYFGKKALISARQI